MKDAEKMSSPVHSHVPSFASLTLPNNYALPLSSPLSTAAPPGAPVTLGPSRSPSSASRQIPRLGGSISLDVMGKPLFASATGSTARISSPAPARLGLAMRSIPSLAERAAATAAAANMAASDGNRAQPLQPAVRRVFTPFSAELAMSARASTSPALPLSSPGPSRARSENSPQYSQRLISSPAAVQARQKTLPLAAPAPAPVRSPEATPSFIARASPVSSVTLGPSPRSSPQRQSLLGVTPIAGTAPPRFPIAYSSGGRLPSEMAPPPRVVQAEDKRLSKSSSAAEQTAKVPEQTAAASSDATPDGTPLSTQTIAVNGRETSVPDPSTVPEAGPATPTVSDPAALFIAGAVRAASVAEGDPEASPFFNDDASQSLRSFEDVVTAWPDSKVGDDPNQPASASAASLRETACDDELPDGQDVGRDLDSSADCMKPISDLQTVRLQRPHGYFPFDIFSSKHAWKALLENGGYGLNEDLIQELCYVQDHCMVPPFPWGQIVYHTIVKQFIVDCNIEGDFAEFGIGLGGTSVFLARLAKKYSRKFLAVDSFEGLPEPNAEKDNHYFLQGDYCPPSGLDNYARWVSYVSRFDVDDVLHTEKCFFKDAIIPREFGKLAFVHLDSDLYESVYDSLEKVWDLMPEGGIIAIDDFFHHAQGPARAVSDFFRVRCPSEEPPLLYVVPCYAVVVMKGRSACLWKPGDPESPEERRNYMHSPRALDGNFYSFKLVRNCSALVQAVERSAERATQLLERIRSDDERAAVARCLSNAQSFLSFLRYPENAARSGSDILRYLLPLEDTWDVQQGTLCGVPGEARRQIQIKI